VRIGDIDVRPVIDGVAMVPTSEPWIGMSEDTWRSHPELLTADGHIELGMGGFLVRTAGRVVLVDLGCGMRDGMFTGGRFLTSLAELGVTPSDVTDVVLTHLHFDHIGWATRHGDVVFPNAVHRWAEQDWAWFSANDAHATRKLQPVVDAGRVECWDASGPLLPGVDLMLMPGHTPGSTVVVLASGDARAMLLGDIVHCPIELVDDEWEGMADVDPAMARAARIALARELEGTDTLVAPAHFPGLHFGRLIAREADRTWLPVS
jgi:glyoxylase-like metal-dependent hydrolase (beta-lactamase superfamily II)